MLFRSVCGGQWVNLQQNGMALVTALTSNRGSLTGRLKLDKHQFLFA